jgi:hypothetical protein
MLRYMVSISVVVSIVLSNKKTPVTVGGFGMPFALHLKAQNPPVTGVLIVKRCDVTPDYQFGGLLLGIAKIGVLLKQINNLRYVVVNLFYVGISLLILFKLFKNCVGL